MTMPGQGSRTSLTAAAQSQAPVAAITHPISASAPLQAVTVPGARILNLLSLAGEQLTHAEQLLLRPTTHSIADLIHALEACCDLLTQLDSLLRSRSTADHAPGLAPDSALLAGAARHWQRSLQRLAGLTAGATSFCNGWASMAGYLPAYSSAGTAPPPVAEGSQLDRLG
jgi:hypothetical protein